MLGQTDPTQILFWSIVVILIIMLLYNFKGEPKVNIESYCGESHEPYFTGKPAQIIAAKQIARQQQGASIQEGKNVGEMDLQHGLY